uniref:Uncharacterized protein n=1 Tax=Candidatus Kentrum sp. TC TaxID=2126339 RepID=A0A450YQD9_9GAMM|nr:MAG: hypothetical protein BECKTC1821E_GA0114239_10282 [Candidatus Kentron sp. TC]
MEYGIVIPQGINQSRKRIPEILREPIFIGMRNRDLFTRLDQWIRLRLCCMKSTNDNGEPIISDFD